MNISVVGLGLIGGSIAKAIKENTTHKVFGFDKKTEVLQKAQDEGSIDAFAEDFSAVDFIIIALYPHDAVKFMKENKKDFAKKCIIVDLCGIKRYVCEEAELLFKDTDIVFVGGHPMAGREFWGFDYASADLFQGASMILTPDEHVSSENMNQIKELFCDIGFNDITITTPKEHDEIIALTSQLAHIVSSAYVQDPSSEKFRGFSAGSFRDMTRVAKLNEHMWTELFLLNSDFLIGHISELIDQLADFKALIENNNEKGLSDKLQKGRLIKERLIISDKNE